MEIKRIFSNIENPIHFNFPITKFCNYKCSYCIANNFSGSNAHIEYKNIIEKLKIIDDEYIVCLSGGEPTMHPECSEIINELLHCKNLKILHIFTNLSKEINFFKQFVNNTQYHKLEILFSFHPEYFNEKIFNKMLEFNFVFDKFSVNIMMHNKQKYWDDIERIIHFCKNNNIDYSLNMIRSTSKYPVIYTNKFKERFFKYFDESNYHEYLFIEYNDGSITEMKPDDIIIKGMNHFKDFKCEAKYWNIDYSGKITNICTNEIVPHIIPRNYFKQYQKCILDECDCTSKIEFKKERYE